MATAILRVGGRHYELACREGEEAELERLATMVDGAAEQAGRALGTTNEARQLLLAGLLLADQLSEARRTGRDEPETTAGLADALNILAERVERLAETLEMTGPAS